MQKTSSSCGSHLSTSLYAQTNTSILWAFIEGLVAMRYFYGMPSFFFTYSPDDINGVLNIKLSLPQTNNQEFQLMVLDSLLEPKMEIPPSTAFQFLLTIYESCL